MNTNLPFDPATLRFYSEIAPTYRASGRDGRNRFLDRFIAKLPARARVVDLGCGGGIDAATFLKHGFMVDAIEASRRIAAETSGRLGIDVRVKRFDQIEDVEVYDAAWASASLIHVPRSALSDVIRRIFRALKPGGIHLATFKSGGREGRDQAGRYYNYPSEQELLSFYLASAPWQITGTERYVGGGFDGGTGPWVMIEATKPA